MRLLLVAPRYPWPARRGDQLRTLQHLDGLRREHEVTLLVPEPPPGAPEPPAGVRVECYASDSAGALSGVAQALGRGWPLQAGLYRQPALARRLRELAPGSDRVVLVLARLGLHLDDAGEVPVVVDHVDSLALNFRRRARFDRPWWRPFLLWEAERLAAAERTIAERALACLVVGERDRWSMVTDWPEPLRAKLHVVRLAVPEGPPRTPVRTRPDPPRLAVTGNLGYFPTREGLRWWLERVWPVLRRRRPDLELVVAGSRAPGALRRLAGRDGIELRESPSDLGAVLREADLAIAPLRAGSGVPVKVLEAWSAGVPVVATSWAAQGAEARPGVDCAVCSSVGEWVDTLPALLSSPARRESLAREGAAHLLKSHAPAVVTAELAAALELG